MIPTEMQSSRPDQLVLFAQANQGTGAKPLANAVITVGGFGTISPMSKLDYLNNADNTIVAQSLSTSNNAFRRPLGLWWLDVYLRQDISATLQFQERNIGLIAAALQSGNWGTAWTHQVRPGVPFKQSFRVHNAEFRLVYTNGPTNTANFDFFVAARSA